MMRHLVHIEDLVEIASAIENDRPIAPWTERRLYPILEQVVIGDIIELIPGLEGPDHYKET